MVGRGRGGRGRGVWNRSWRFFGLGKGERVVIDAKFRGGHCGNSSLATFVRSSDCVTEVL